VFGHAHQSSPQPIYTHRIGCTILFSFCELAQFLHALFSFAEYLASSGLRSRSGYLGGVGCCEKPHCASRSMMNCLSTTVANRKMRFQRTAYRNRLTNLGLELLRLCKLREPDLELHFNSDPKASKRSTTNSPLGGDYKAVACSSIASTPSIIGASIKRWNWRPLPLSFGRLENSDDSGSLKSADCLPSASWP
jgi:hypothetical protein